MTTSNRLATLTSRDNVLSTGSRSSGGYLSSTGTPSHPPKFQVLPAAQVKWSNTSVNGAYDRVNNQGRPSRRLLEASWQAVRRAASEGSLQLMVAGSLNARQIRRSRGRGGEHEGVAKGSDGGLGSFSREDNMRGSGGSELEGGGEGRRS